MSKYDEIELMAGSRQWAYAQDAFRGSPNPSRASAHVDTSWYGTAVDENDGAFALVRSGSTLESDLDLVGEYLKVTYRSRSIFVYCVGGADLTTDFALARAAFVRLDMLYKDEIPNVLVEVCTIGDVDVGS